MQQPQLVELAPPAGSLGLGQGLWLLHEEVLAEYFLDQSFPLPLETCTLHPAAVSLGRSTCSLGGCSLSQGPCESWAHTGQGWPLGHGFSLCVPSVGSGTRLSEASVSSQTDAPDVDGAGAGQMSQLSCAEVFVVGSV